LWSPILWFTQRSRSDILWFTQRSRDAWHLSSSILWSPILWFTQRSRNAWHLSSSILWSPTYHKRSEVQSKLLQAFHNPLKNNRRRFMSIIVKVHWSSSNNSGLPLCISAYGLAGVACKRTSAVSKSKKTQGRGRRGLNLKTWQVTYIITYTESLAGTLNYKVDCTLAVHKHIHTHIHTLTHTHSHNSQGGDENVEPLAHEGSNLVYLCCIEPVWIGGLECGTSGSLLISCMQTEPPRRACCNIASPPHVVDTKLLHSVLPTRLIKRSCIQWSC
jgi:hypothetical protein